VAGARIGVAAHHLGQALHASGLDLGLAEKPRDGIPTARDARDRGGVFDLIRVSPWHPIPEEPASLAQEVGSRNITVNCVAPGFVATDMTRDLPETARAAMLARVPLGRLGEPADIAHAVAFLASPRAGYITGATLHVNGGMYMA